MIKAKGVRNGKQLEVVYDNGKFTYNGKRDFRLDKDMEYELSLCHAMGGTYFPKRNEMRNIYNVMQNHFFDYNADVETDEEIEPLEHEEGRIY